MYKVILFDLDGTLLPVDTNMFLHQYLKLIKENVKELYNPDLFVNHVLEGSKYMIKNKESEKSNEEVFFDYFLEVVDLSKNELNSFFEYFYDKEFPKLETYIGQTNDIPLEIIKYLRKKGYQIVIATNPVFPRKAIEHRLSWINISPDECDLITSYENMHHAKPNPKYYSEISSKLNVRQENCLMIGNDTKEDLVAKKVGMEVFLVTDYLIDQGEGYIEELSPDQKGTLNEMSNLLKQNL
ncbi:HAD family hydrolase [Natranaerobius trueperi]|uniref:Hydrolase n=1 Tax=Natranaerobius trueperi TaxID=759412 RepID=A0A226C277_9FIRM|nr:HAD family hydrolase [Natranaerobius trueperi]OWZ84704.1 hypothetical protein CDO51_01370 [Natranaerobius trueperi]